MVYSHEGYKVLRFWDNQVFIDIEGVLENIRNALLTPHPDPVPQGEESQKLDSGSSPE
ncbi:MAG: DUF559 domain-containing protein [Deltaproteobacteria bacterium]|nr:MAG: DUF559 domain-containing protein [Deltaproteobacteria bacterium]